VRSLAVLVLSLALAPAASAQEEIDPPCPPGVAPSATIRAEDLRDRGGSLTATHEIALELQVTDRPDPIDEFALSVPPGVKTGYAGTPTIQVDTPGQVTVTATWSDYYPQIGTSCSTSTPATLDIEPARPPQLVTRGRSSGYTTAFEWFLRWGKDADLRPVELRVRGVRRARLPRASASVQKTLLGLRSGDRGAPVERIRVLRSGGWKFTASPWGDGGEIRIHMHDFARGGRPGFGIDLELVQAGRRLGRARLVGRCDSLACRYRKVR
jgi:hypothetical protein